MTSTRKEQFEKLFPDMPKFRLRQINEALFCDAWKGWMDVSNLSSSMRECVSSEITWLSCEEVVTLESKKKDTFKAVLRVDGGHRIETVLMKNPRQQWTVCVSSQIGCAMKCSFCATGTMGLIRNLTSDEIVDQYRFWKIFLAKHPDLPQRISNIVFMGMGEPLVNYDNVKESLRLILEHTDIGPTRITVSTVGLIPMLEKVIKDPEWPPVRLAVSLHSADSNTRKALMPSSYDGFLEKLAEWTKQYFEKFDTKRRHLTFEYIMLSDVNDTSMHARALASFAKKIGKVRINLIPYNFTGSEYLQSKHDKTDEFLSYLKTKNVDVTKRRTMGDDIAAACGQLVVERNKNENK